MSFALLVYFLEVSAEELIESRVSLSVLLDKCQFIAGTKSVFQEKRTAETL